jgi:hypothetical protein
LYEAWNEPFLVRFCSYIADAISNVSLDDFTIAVCAVARSEHAQGTITQSERKDFDPLSAVALVSVAA